MKNLRVAFLFGVLGGAVSWLGAPAVAAAAEDAQGVEQLRRQLLELQDRFERERQEHLEQIKQLSARIDELQKEQDSRGEKSKLERELAAELSSPSASNAITNALAPVPRTWSPADPIRVQTGGSYLDLSLVGTFAAGSSTADDIGGGLELGGHDPNQRGFTVQGVELTLSGAVDPYFRANANLVFQTDETGGSFFELEEAWMETISLPANLQLRAGQLMTEFGRINATHPHSWAFVDSPLVTARLLGPDGLRNPGARLSWLAPTPFYSEFFLHVQNSQGETAASFRWDGDPSGHAEPQKMPFAYRYADNDRGVQHLQDMLFVPRYTLSLDLTETQVLLAGVSAAFGPNSSGDSGVGETDTQIYGLDLTWKWKPLTHHGGFPFLSFQTEALLRRYEAGRFDWDLNGDGVVNPGEVMDARTGAPALLQGESLTDYGFYSQLLYGFRKGWVAGVRFDYVASREGAYERAPLVLDGQRLGRDPQRALRWRISPDLTWYPTEFSKLRLQYNLDDRSEGGVDHSVWLQMEFLLGAHAAHKF